MTNDSRMIFISLINWICFNQPESSLDFYDNIPKILSQKNSELRHPDLSMSKQAVQRFEIRTINEQHLNIINSKTFRVFPNQKYKILSISVSMMKDNRHSFIIIYS